MKTALRDAALPGTLGLVLLLISILTRPLIPLDETRLASVAWEMWNRGSWIVPHLNGVPYSHKPPLLYWIVGLGWWAFGVNAVWVRLVPALFALLGSVLTARMARRLWPQDVETATLAPWLLFGTGLWTAFGDLFATYDAPLAFFVLAGAFGILRASEARLASGFACAGLALGLGLLTKGPVVLVPVLPLALLAPWWGGAAVRERPGAWYAGCLLALTLAIAVALSWVIPAAHLGGPDYGAAILWNQTAHRLVGSFAHRRSFWFYLAFLPIVLAPWSLWPEAWRSLARLLRRPERGVRFCLALCVPAPILLSLVSGKQVYYLLPVLPAFALLLSRALSVCSAAPKRSARAPTALLLGVLGALLLGLARGGLRGHAEWSGAIPAACGVTLLLGGIVVLLLPLRSSAREARLLAGTTGFVLLVLHVGALPPVLAVLDLRSVASVLARAEREGRPLAHAGAYEGQYHFLGRLRTPLQVIEPEDAVRWARAHPRGELVLYGRGYARPGHGWAPQYTLASRGRTLEIWSSETFLGRSLTASRGGR